MPFFSRKPLIVCAQALQLIPSTFQLTVSILISSKRRWQIYRIQREPVS
jgi:hypothetical protein